MKERTPKSTQSENRRLEEEIRSLRIGTWLAVFGFVLSVVGQVWTNRAELLALVRTQTLRVSTEDVWLATSAEVQIEDLRAAGSPLTANFAIATAGLELAPGLYRVAVTRDSRELWHDIVKLDPGEPTEVVVPPQTTGGLEVRVESRTPEPLPTQELDLRVASSGNGWLWVYQLVPGAPPDRILPLLGGEPVPIGPEAPLGSPTVRILAGAAGMKETLVFLVTSTPDPSEADARAATVFGPGTTKASLGQGPSWGATTLSYTVRAYTGG